MFYLQNKQGTALKLLTVKCLGLSLTSLLISFLVMHPGDSG